MLGKLILLFLSLGNCVVNGFIAKREIDSGQNELFQLSIIHNNDFHARFVPISSASGTCKKGKENECIGGLARMATVARQLKKEQKNSIFLNGGDNFQGTVWYNIFKWNATAYFMNKLPYDAITIGNHDFDDRIAGLVPFLQNLQFPVVVTNIDASEEPTIQGLYKNSTIIVRDNQTIGVIGVVTKTANELSKPEKLKLLDEVESINSEAERLKAKGVKIIIVVGHVGLDVDRIIAAKCPDVDVIVGGHTHTFLYSGKPPYIDVPEDEYPVVVRQNDTNRTVLIVQASAFTRYLGNLTVWFNNEGEVVNWEGNPVFLANSIVEDPEILEELKPWAEAVEAFGGKYVGETKSFLSSTCRSGECNLANLVTDAMVHAYKSKADSADSWTYAAIGCTNAGGIRADIPVGNITYGDLATVLPFDHTWDVVELKGEDLQRALEESVSHVRDKESFVDEAGFLQCSGIKVVYNMTEPAWSRIQSLSVRCQDCKEPKFESLDRDKWYRVVLVPFILTRGDGLTVIADKHRNHQLGPLDVTGLEEYVESISPFTYELDQRVQIVS